MAILCLVRFMPSTILFFIGISVIVSPGNASELGSIDHPCNEYTFMNCDPDQNLIKAVFSTETIEQCQEICNDSKYNKDCEFFIFNNEKEKWNCLLVTQTLQDYLEQCNELGGPREPTISQCLESDDACKVSNLTFSNIHSQL